MDDGEVELADHVLLNNSESSSSVRASVSVDSFLHELLKTAQTCTHTHTCNPPGPDSAHTHTCYHTHTQIFPSEEENNPGSKLKRPSGNREAVRKYREKKKAHTAYLEEEVKKLRFVNQQLVRKLQRQAVLESEVLRLRRILVDVRGKIDNELTVFPFQKQCNSTISFKEGNCAVKPTSKTNLRSERDFPGSSAEACGITGCWKMVESWEGNCQPPVMDCQAKVNDNGNRENA